MNEDLRQWLRQNWIDISRKKKGGGHPACGASADKGVRAKDSSKKYPKCVPANKAKSMSKKEKKNAVKRKRAADNKPGKPDFVKTKLKKEELNLLEYQMKLDNLLEFLMEEKLSEQTAPPVDAAPGNPLTGEDAGTTVVATGTVEQPKNSTAKPIIATPSAGAVRTAEPQPIPGQPGAAPAGVISPVPVPAGGAAPAGVISPVPAPAGGAAPAGVLPLLPLAEDLSALTEDQLLEILTSEELDPVGHENSDINNDGIKNDKDEYLLHRREVRSKAIKSSLSESVKYQELQNQERRRKSLIKVQNKIIYAKK